MDQNAFPPREVRCKFCRQKFLRPYHTAYKYCSNECKFGSLANKDHPIYSFVMDSDVSDKVIDLYKEGYSAQEIKESLNLAITTRSIQRFLKSRGLTRTVKESFQLAMQRGRVSWNHLKKAGRVNEYRKCINSRLRYVVLQRDNFKCVLCGNGAKEGIRLEVDHIIGKIEGGTNDLENLRTLCGACNLGRWNVEQKDKWRTTRNWPKDIKNN